MYKINEWDKRYEVSSKGREPKDGDDLRAGPLQYVRLKVYGHRQGTGFRRLQLKAKDKTMEIFGIFCKFLEIAGNQRRGLRGELLNEKDKPASIDDLAFILGVPAKQVSYALDILSSKDVGWLINTTQHNSTQLNSTQASGKRRKRPETSGNSVLFERFWQAYPNKKARAECIRVWTSPTGKFGQILGGRKPDEKLVDEMLEAIEWQKSTDGWKKDKGRFIPYPATWLNQGRWQDKPVEEPKQKVSHHGR